MRFWMFGNVDGWIDSRRGGSKHTCIFDALCHSDVGMNFVFLFEDGRLLAVKDLTEYFRGYTNRYGKAQWKDLPPDHAACKSAGDMTKKYGGNERVSQEMEREVLALLNLEEKNDEQSN